MAHRGQGRSGCRQIQRGANGEMMGRGREKMTGRAVVGEGWAVAWVPGALLSSLGRAAAGARPSWLLCTPCLCARYAVRGLLAKGLHAGLGQVKGLLCLLGFLGRLVGWEVGRLVVGWLCVGCIGHFDCGRPHKVHSLLCAGWPHPVVVVRLGKRELCLPCLKHLLKCTTQMHLCTQVRACAHTQMQNHTHKHTHINSPHTRVHACAV